MGGWWHPQAGLPIDELRAVLADVGRSAQVYVVRNREHVIEPVRQVFATAAEAWPGHRPGDAALEVAADVRTRRRWRQARGLDGTVLVCGEVNVVQVEDALIRTPDGEALPGAGLVLNPAHTFIGPQKVRDKRAWLAREGLLLTTANVHPGTAALRASATAAEIYYRGERHGLGSGVHAVGNGGGPVRAERLWLADDTSVVIGEVDLSGTSTRALGQVLTGNADVA